MTSPARRILLVRTGGLGDVLLALPALRAIRNAFPHARISFLSSSGAGPVLAGEGLWDELLSFERSPQRPGGFLVRSRFEQIAWSVGLPFGGYDTVAVLQPVLSRAGALRLRAMVSLSRARQTVGRDTDGRGGFYRSSFCEQLDDDLHEVERVFGVANLLGVDGPRDASIALAPDARSAADLFLRQSGLDGVRPLIGINPGSFRPSYRWPAERFAEVASALVRQKGGAVILVGAPGEEVYAGQLTRAIPSPVVSAIGKTKLSDLPAFLARLDVLITNDTGTMHVAAAAGASVVAVFARGDPRRTGPYAPRDRARAITNHVCGLPNGFGCRDPRCLLSVSVEQVLEAALELLK